MELTRNSLDTYTNAVNAISKRGSSVLKIGLRQIDYSQPIESVRHDVLAVMEATCSAATDMSSVIAADFYDGLRAQVFGEPMGALANSQRNPAATEKALRAFLRKIVEEEYEEFEDLCVERLDYEVKRAAGRTVQYNVQNDPYEGETRWARVPTGDETCDFCIMLASRGPVYLSAESAGADSPDHYHAHCDCRIVPFWGTFEIGPSRRGSIMDIEGYDPDALYERYAERMLDPNFRASVAKTGHGSGLESSRPQMWAKAYKDGEVSFRSVGEIETYLSEAPTYEALFERIGLVGSELPKYGLSKAYIRLLQTVAERRRSELLDQ